MSEYATGKSRLHLYNRFQTVLLQLGYGREGNTEIDDQLIKWHADELYQKHTRDKSKKAESSQDQSSLSGSEKQS